MKEDSIKKIADKIDKSQRIVITSHLRPDGDSICTGLALYYMGRHLGKEMAIINKDKTPFPFNHLPDIDKIQIGQIPPDLFDLVILLECANVERSGQEEIQDYFKINIDHHHSNDYYGDINWVDPEASAVASMAYSLAKDINVTLDPQIANHLYCGIVSDTGSFQFSNTRAQSFKVCYHLIKEGADPVVASERLFNNNPPEKVKLQGLVLSTLQMNPKGNIAVVTMFKKFLDSLRLKEIDTEDITTQVRSIKGIQMVLFFKEIKKDTYRVSLRSKGTANSAKVAESFGGGGHLHAAGFTATGNYADLVRQIPDEVDKILSQSSIQPDNDLKSS